MTDSTLTTKRDLFVSAYLGEAHGNATEAARMAGYKKPGQEGSRLLKNAEIAARISQHTAEAGATRDQVLNELASVALAPWTEFVEVLSRDKTGKPLKVKMDLTNKVKALELLGKYHGLFVERQEVNVNIREHRVFGVAGPELEAVFRPAQPRELTA